MKNLLRVVSFFVLALPAVSHAAPQYREITNANSSILLNDLGQTVWLSGQSAYQQDTIRGIYFNDGNQTTKLGETVTPYGSYAYPSIVLNNQGQVAWTDGHQVYLYDNGVSVPISESFDYLYNLQINDQGSLAWQGGAGIRYDIFLYRNGAVENLTGTPNEWEYFRDLNNNDQLVYEKYDANGRNYYYYDGAAEHSLTANSSIKDFGQLNDEGVIAWYEYDSQKIYTYDLVSGQTKEVATTNPPQGMKQAGNFIVWGDSNITGLDVYYYNGNDGAVRNLSADSPVSVNFWSDVNAQGSVIWSPRIGSTADAYNYGLDYIYFDGQNSQDITPHFDQRVWTARLSGKNQIAFGAYSSAYVSVDSETPAAPVPEPATILLMGVGLPAAAWLSRKKRQG